MADVNDIADIIRIMGEQPEWADTLRGALLSKELLELPEQFARHESLLTRTLEATNARLDNLDRQFGGLTGRLDNEFGTTYENKVQKNLPSYVAQHLELRAPTVLKGPLTTHDPNLEGDAERAAMRRVITWGEYSQVLLADLIFTARPRLGGDMVHAVAQVSITAGADDINRARGRADILTRVRDTPVIALVFSANVDDERTQKALENNVTIVRIPT